MPNEVLANMCGMCMLTKWTFVIIYNRQLTVVTIYNDERIFLKH